MYQKFCRQVGDGVGLALIACLSTILLSCMSAFNLFRLYGKNKEREAHLGDSIFCNREECLRLLKLLTYYLHIIMYIELGLLSELRKLHSLPLD